MSFSIFQINHGNDIKSWVCAKTNIHALQTCESHTDVELNDYNDYDSVEEISRDEWSKYTISRDWTDEKQTFEDFMKDANQAEIIAENIEQ